MNEEEHDLRRITAMLRKHKGTIYRVAAMHCNCTQESYRYREMVCDLTTYLWEVYSGLPEGAVIFREQAWVFTILMRYAMMMARQEEQHQQRLEYDADLSHLADAADADPLVMRMYHLIDQLDPDDRDLVNMYLDKVPVWEIAAIRHTSMSYVYRRINMLVDKLRQLNKQLGDDWDDDWCGIGPVEEGDANEKPLGPAVTIKKSNDEQEK